MSAMIRLLVICAYNYVIVPNSWFWPGCLSYLSNDFDQQCYEGNFKIYRPQFFKEKYPMVY
jgi:hypothetical protein